MANGKHTVRICDAEAAITGVISVESVCDKEAVVCCERGKLYLRGKGISVKKLDLEQGELTLTSQQIDSLYYGAATKKFSLKGLFG